MSKTYTHYYTLLKSGEIRFQKRQPKGKPFVTEVGSYHVGVQNHSVHTLIGPTGENRTLDAWHGYDRGPRLKGMITSMFGRAL